MKKRILSLCSLLIVMNVLPAQTAQEALSLSTSNYFLSARQTAMGGASGALFSEMGAIAVNPAIIGTYQTCELSFTPLYYNLQSKADYLSNVRSENRFGFVLGSAGVVYSIQPRGTGQRYNIGFVYNRMNSFNSNTLAGGTLATNNSFWQELANQMSTSGDQQFIDWGGQTPLFKNNGGVYSPQVASGSDITQDNNIDMTGNVGEYALSFGVNLGEMVNLGISAVLRDAYMSTIYTTREAETGTDNYYTYEYRSEVMGLGIGGKLGITVTPIAGLNFGAAIHSPVYYSMRQRIKTEVTVPSPPYTSGTIQTNHNLLTPLQFVISASYDIMGRVLLSADYEGTPYTMANLSTASGTTLDLVNAEIDQTKYVSTIRFGAEVPVWQGLCARAGGGFRTGVDTYNKDSYHLGGGLGYRFGEASIDVAYTYLNQALEYPLYTGATLINNTRGTNMINFSLSYRF